ncbi:MAG: hypothetical protein U5K79_22640 [Cyclobacteriaceae bacterium]|nr:hypothetical protein [Cyclobacteriaceae bacterium]
MTECTGHLIMGTTASGVKWQETVSGVRNKELYIVRKIERGSRQRGWGDKGATGP